MSPTADFFSVLTHDAILSERMEMSTSVEKMYAHMKNKR